MKEKDFKKILKQSAASAVVPDVLDKVKGADFSLYREHEPQTAQKKKRGAILLAAASLAVVLLLGFVLLPYITFDREVFATVNLSVKSNASYSIDINKSSKVLEITADSTEAGAVLEGISYRRRDFESTVTELLKAFVDTMDLTEEELNNNGVVYSVSCHDKDAVIHIQNALNNCVDAAKQHCKNKHGNGHGEGHDEEHG